MVGRVCLVKKAGEESAFLKDPGIPPSVKPCAYPPPPPPPFSAPSKSRRRPRTPSRPRGMARLFVDAWWRQSASHHCLCPEDLLRAPEEVGH